MDRDFLRKKLNSRLGFPVHALLDLYRLAQDEMRRVFDRAFRDSEIGETIALKESVLLDVN